MNPNNQFTETINRPQQAPQEIIAIRQELSKVIVGQERLIDRLLLAMLCDGHVLLEGTPGVAKTLTINTLAKTLDAIFSRIQLTPDLLPSDLTGTIIYDPKQHRFSAEKGPIFANILLADEINRAPAKVQSALLEAMQEKQVTLGKQSYPLPKPFIVLATQNPIEQEGTYPLPEAQVDRFMFKLKVQYPSLEEELQVVQRMGRPQPSKSVSKVLNLEALEALRAKLWAIYIDEKIERYLLRIVRATREPALYDLKIAPYIRYGASPRASIFLALAARGHALMEGADYVRPNDVKAVAHDVLRHRIALSYRAEAESIVSETLIDQILNQIPIHITAEAG